MEGELAGFFVRHARRLKAALTCVRRPRRCHQSLRQQMLPSLRPYHSDARTGYCPLGHFATMCRSWTRLRDVAQQAMTHSRMSKARCRWSAIVERRVFVHRLLSRVDGKIRCGDVDPRGSYARVPGPVACAKTHWDCSSERKDDLFLVGRVIGRQFHSSLPETCVEPHGWKLLSLVKVSFRTRLIPDSSRFFWSGILREKRSGCLDASSCTFRSYLGPI